MAKNKKKVKHSRTPTHKHTEKRQWQRRRQIKMRDREMHTAQCVYVVCASVFSLVSQSDK